MGYLKQLLQYKKICIQCHNNPDSDTLASAYAVYCYLTEHNVESWIVYGGEELIKKGGTKLMVRECHIPIQHVESLPEADLLLLVDCQYAQGNVEKFPAEKIAMIDHHIRVVEGEDNLIRSEYQSCSTLIYELLKEENYPVKENELLSVALLYGLYIDTSCFQDLFKEADIAMKNELFANQPLFDRLSKSSMTVAELLVASDAMYNHYFDVKRRFAIVEALNCEQAVLGIIGDFMILVDTIYLSFAYTEAGAGYQISIRTCHEKLEANKIAAFVCDGIGGGGGHSNKAGGRIIKEKMQEEYGDKSVFDVVQMRLCEYIDSLE